MAQMCKVVRSEAEGTNARLQWQDKCDQMMLIATVKSKDHPKSVKVVDRLCRHKMSDVRYLTSNIKNLCGASVSGTVRCQLSR
jgi:hypothetical protein